MNGATIDLKKKQRSLGVVKLWLCKKRFDSESSESALGTSEIACHIPDTLTI
jgi:hypothetical protein